MVKNLNSIKSLKSFLKEIKPSKVLIVTSRALVNKLNWAIKEVPHTHLTTLPDGELAKEWSQVEKLLKQFGKVELDRKSIVIALGGGTIGDVVGFASAIYMRGIGYVQVPTTLLSQVDSAHGGKTGINFLGYKNQIGVYHNPLATVIDIRFLKSLSRDQLIDGLGAIKRSSTLALLIKKSIAVKQFYIRKDPKEVYLRQILNAGHTVGHAIELKYKLSHGKAVLFGLLKELSACESLGFTPRSVRENLEILLNQLDIRIDKKLSVDLKSLYRDKKISNGTIMFPVIEKEGKAKLVPIKFSQVKKHLTSVFE